MSASLMDRVLITGGAGFIGGALGRELVRLGHRVTAIDDLSTGQLSNVAEGVELVRANVADRSAMREIFEAGRFGAVLHLAAQTSNILSHQDPWNDFSTNVGGTLNVIEQVTVHRVPKVLFASSMALYGNAASLPTAESAALAPLSPYGVSKLAAEHLLHNAATRRDAPRFRLGSLRMFNVYGPGQSLTNMYQGVVSVFIANVLAGEPITLYGSGAQTRDFVYIDDIVAAWLAALASDDLDGERVNLGSGEECTISALLDAVLAAFGHSRATYEVIQRAELAGDQRAVRADIRLARQRLGWAPRVPFEQGLRATVEWAKATWPALRAVSAGG
jgi:UDP-glucose 4-epimerase